MKSKYKPIALVTGAASGIGSAISFALCDSGFDLIALGRSAANLAEMTAHDDIRPLAFDLTDRVTIATALEGEEVDILVNRNLFAHKFVSYDLQITVKISI